MSNDDAPLAEPITTSKRLIHNTTFNVVTLFVNAVVGFLLIGFFLDKLGEAAYGVWVLLGGSIFRYGGMLNMGLNSAINRYVPIYLVQNDFDGIRRVVSTSFAFFLFTSTVLFISCFVVYWNLESWFQIRPDLIPGAKAVVLSVGLTFAISLPLQIYTAVLSGVQRYDVMNLALIFALALRTSLLVILLIQGHGLLTMGVVFGCSEIAARGVQLLAVRRFVPSAKFSASAVNLSLLRDMLAYGINTFMYGMGAMLICSANNIVIGVFIGEAEVSRFAVAAAAVLLLSQLLTAFTRAIKPAVSDLDARNDRDRIKELAFLSQKYSLLVIIPSVCFFVMMGDEFLSVWVGARFAEENAIEQMARIMAILALGHFFRLAQHSNFLVLVGRGEHRIFGILTAATAAVCVIASVVSVYVFDGGLIAIAWANFVPMAVISGGSLSAYFNWKLAIPWRDCIVRAWLPAILGCLPSLALMSVWNFIAPPRSWWDILKVIFVVGGLTVCGAWFFSLQDIEKRRFLHVLKPITGRRQ